jgi:hypothetical protein
MARLPNLFFQSHQAFHRVLSQLPGELAICFVPAMDHENIFFKALAMYEQFISI